MSISDRDGVIWFDGKLVPWRDAVALQLDRATFRVVANDVLLEIAVRMGLDYTRAKAVLDVDRHAEAVTMGRERAERLGVQGVPTLRADHRTLQGFRSGAEVRTFLSRVGDR